MFQIVLVSMRLCTEESAAEMFKLSRMYSKRYLEFDHFWESFNEFLEESTFLILWNFISIGNQQTSVRQDWTCLDLGIPYDTGIVH